MSIWQVLLMDLGRMGLGLVFLFSCVVDLQSRRQLFQLMLQKRVRFPWVFFVGALLWKSTTSLLLILHIYTTAAALLLSLYIFLANLIFNNFWTADKEHRAFSTYLFLIYLASCFSLLFIAGGS